jgi:hypothetical protein
MRDRRPRAGEPKSGDEELLSALRQLGTGYEPDLTVISQQIESAQRPRAAHDTSASASLAHSVFRRSVLLPAAAVLVIIGGTVLVTSQGGTSPDPASTKVQPISSAPVPPTISPGTSRRPTAGAPRVGPAVSATAAGAPTTAVPGTTPAGPHSSDPTAPASTGSGTGTEAVSVRALNAGATEALGLTGGGLRDWLVVGGRADLKQVRLKGTTAAPLVAVTQPAKATSVAGPFRVSWQDGVPEQSHTGADRWLQSGGEAGLTVTVAASSSPRTLTLFAGAQDLDATLSFTGTVLDGLTQAVTVASTGARQGFVVTVTLPPTSDLVQLKLGGTANGPAPRVFLAALTLR